MCIRDRDKITFKKLRQEFITTKKPLLLLMGFSWGWLIILLLMAYQVADIITVVIVSTFSFIVNVLIGIFIRHEKKNIKIKIIALILVVAGLIVSAI